MGLTGPSQSAEYEEEDDYDEFDGDDQEDSYTSESKPEKGKETPVRKRSQKEAPDSFVESGDEDDYGSSPEESLSDYIKWVVKVI